MKLARVNGHRLRNHESEQDRKYCTTGTARSGKPLVFAIHAIQVSFLADGCLPPHLSASGMPLLGIVPWRTKRVRCRHCYQF
jgi:hypothetical protein